MFTGKKSEKFAHVYMREAKCLCIFVYLERSDSLVNVYTRQVINFCMFTTAQ